MTSVVRWPASVRLQDAKDGAPGGLGFVQDLLNTVNLSKLHEPDLLEQLESAQEWLDESLALVDVVDPDAASTLRPVVLDMAGLRALRLLRDGIRAVLSVDPDAEPAAGVGIPSVETIVVVDFGIEGVRLRPRGKGVELVRSYALIQLAAAGFVGTVHRLKVCANPLCRSAFYDRSKNTSRIWHDVSSCGNTQNVRAYRARLKGNSAPSAQ